MCSPLAQGSLVAREPRTSDRACKIREKKGQAERERERVDSFRLDSTRLDSTRVESVETSRVEPHRSMPEREEHPEREIPGENAIS